MSELDAVGPDEIASWRVIYASRLHDLVPELRRAAFQQIVICDLALDGLKYRRGEVLPGDVIEPAAWIEVEKRLPEVGQRVWIWHNWFRRPFVGELVDPEIQHFTDGQGAIFPSHWMPLNEPSIPHNSERSSNDAA